MGIIPKVHSRSFTFTGKMCSHETGRSTIFVRMSMAGSMRRAIGNIIARSRCRGRGSLPVGATRRPGGPVCHQAFGLQSARGFGRLRRIAQIHLKVRQRQGLRRDLFALRLNSRGERPDQGSLLDVEEIGKVEKLTLVSGPQARPKPAPIVKISCAVSWS